MEIDKQIGCGYCIKEKECKIRSSKINKAKKGCLDWKHYLKEKTK